MIPKLVCPKCGANLEQTDAFCGSCGEKIEWKPASRGEERHDSSPKNGPRGRTCRLCGHANPKDASTCAECGASLGSPGDASVPGKSRRKEPSARSAANAPLSFLQSWKVTAGIGILVIATLIILRLNRTDTTTPAGGGMPPQHDALVKEIQALQQAIDSNPKNTEALLKLGNLYYDQRLFPRAIMLYERYLELNASDPNARVDLGVSYFEMGLQDSLRRAEYFATAIKEMQKATQYDPKHQLAYYNLGMVNLHTGDTKQATEWFKKCYGVDSTTEAGRRAHQLVKNHITTVPSS